MIAIIDYGVGNLFSLVSSFKAIGADALITKDVDTIRRADKIILPGVGAFEDATRKLHESGLDAVLKEQAAAGKPIMGICRGFQLLNAYFGGDLIQQRIFHQERQHRETAGDIAGDRKRHMPGAVQEERPRRRLDIEIG